MKIFSTMLGIALVTGSMVIGEAWAGDLSRQVPVEVTVHLGTQDNKMVFEPSMLKLEAGKLYKLVIDNPSPTKHYFTPVKLANAIWTRKVQMGGTEIKGAITEIQLDPRGRLEWWFVPVQAGTFDITCSVAGHTQQGMVGSIKVE